LLIVLLINFNTIDFVSMVLNEKQMNTRRGNKTPLCLGAGIFLFVGVSILFNGATKAEAAIADHLVINEVQTDSVSGAGGSADDFIELYNPTNTDIVLDGWSIQKQSSASTSAIYKKTLDGTIFAGGYFLIVRGGASTDQSLKDMADVLTASTFSISSNNVIYLVNDNVDIENKEDMNIIDYLGMGSAENFEGLATANNPIETKSIARVPDGEDSDENSIDFAVLDTPNPQNSSAQSGSDLGATVLITITGASPVVQNISPNNAEIVFVVNSNASTEVNYGLDDSYGSASLEISIVANSEERIVLDGLTCDTTYHYSIYAENENGSDSYATTDASFHTLPCGIRLDSLTMTKSAARANNDYGEGWAWEFDITVWDMSEGSLKMKFEEWLGGASLDAGSNMHFSVNGTDWIDILANDSYSDIAADISMIDEDIDSAGRQVKILVQMKVPVGTLAGFYNSNYGILTE
jgi:hypothetical protein